MWQIKKYSVSAHCCCCCCMKRLHEGPNITSASVEISGGSKASVHLFRRLRGRWAPGCRLPSWRQVGAAEGQRRRAESACCSPGLTLSRSSAGARLMLLNLPSFSTAGRSRRPLMMRPSLLIASTWFSSPSWPKTWPPLHPHLPLLHRSRSPTAISSLSGRGGAR